jgi:hypothetical protein
VNIPVMETGDSTKPLLKNKSNSAFKMINKRCLKNNGSPKYGLIEQNNSFESRVQLSAFTEDLDYKEHLEQIAAVKSSKIDALIPHKPFQEPKKVNKNEGKIIGFYTQRERRNKIKKWHSRLLVHKKANPINKIYKGRSNAARSRVRL